MFLDFEIYIIRIRFPCICRTSATLFFPIVSFFFRKFPGVRANDIMCIYAIVMREYKKWEIPNICVYVLFFRSSII